MISVYHLLWIVPLSVVIGIGIVAVFAANDDD
jgi:hypothetical protein